jgi:cytochrome c peroxidase
MKSRLSHVMVGLVVMLGIQLHAGDQRQAFRIPERAPEPADNRTKPERKELGKMLFFDPRLSGSNWMSCASCHNPALGWSDGLPMAIGDEMKTLKRRTPTLLNTGFNTVHMWDGRFKSLEEQAWGPILSEGEMHATEAGTLAKLRAIPEYLKAFERAYPGEGITKLTVAKAIANYERTLTSRDSAFDRWAEGDEGAISADAKRGFKLFVGKANCAACHQGPNFTDQGFHNIGVKGAEDEGRFAKVPIKISRGAFKTPTLRDIALRAPYMHNGAYRTLEEVVDHYDRGGDEKGNLDPNMKPLRLSKNEKKCLVEFMKSVTGKPQATTVPNLPK